MSNTSLSVSSRISYGFGDFGQNVLFQITAFHLLFYLTEVAGLSAGFVGTLFLVSRIWDGLNDPIMGYLAARTNTRWGSYRPYLLWGAPLLALSMYWMFAVPDWSMAAKEWYVAVAYLAFGMVFTFYNVPYGSLTAVMTNSYHERGILTGYRMTFAMIGGIVGATCFLPLVEYFGGGLDGYASTAVVFAAVVLATSVPTFFLVRERIAVTPEEKPKVAEARAYLWRNAPFWWLCLAFGCAFAAYSLYAASLPFAAKYLFDRESLTVPLILTLMGVTGATVPLWTWISGSIGKKKVFLLGAGFTLLSFFLLGMAPQGIDSGWLYLIFAIQGIGNGSTAYTSWAMLPDTIEFGKWKTGHSAPGLTYGIYGFFFKLGLGIGAALAGALLTWVGYQQGQAVTDAMLPAIRSSISWIPFVITLVAWAAIWKYPITAALHQEIRSYLASTA